MRSKKTLVLGASLKPNRYSNIAVNKLRQYKHEVVAFGLKQGIVADVTIDTELKPYDNIDTVTLYLNPKRQEDYYTYITGLKPNRVIFNPGTENPEFYELLKANNISFEVACTLVLLSTNQY
ncbi:CoA-binding protein [uncultured Winogradskyella sp.]|uniref:CoA-binding protein n=1 Tax=uncultured Winogradskyella sp. TaxID=395353 RepID=UPI002617D6B8|nr:CoA-binding protein [uncultured Winogradskyella sp.]